MSAWPVELAERGLVPDAVVAAGIRRLLSRRLELIGEGGEGGAGPSRRAAAQRRRVVEALGRGPIAVATIDANCQHYEVPAELFELVLGPWLKYSGCYWPPGVESLAAAEEAMLELTCERAAIEDGMEILDLGCGWGALTRFMAERYPGARVLAVSNSRGQRRFIEAACRQRGLTNVQVVTADVNRFDPEAHPGAYDPGRRFDRIVSVEMFEHLTNWRAALARLASWLAPDGRVFLHVFCHRRTPYLFEADGDAGGGDWMARHFFTGGMMPAADLVDELLAAGDPLAVEASWQLDGRHYERTARAWLANLDAHSDRVLAVCARCYGERRARRWRQRWRLFFLACAELFGYRDGSEWQVVHHRLRPGGPGVGSGC